MSAIRVFFGGRRSNNLDPFTLQLWDPVGDFALHSSLISARFPACCRETSALANVRIDWKETPEAHLLKADLPGLKKEEVKVEVEDGRVLKISGERNVENEDHKNDTCPTLEHSSGKFLRSFRLPKNAKMNQIKAAMENDVLTITIPKEEVKKPDVRTVEISG